MPSVGDLVANLTLNSRGFSAGLGTARSSLNNFGMFASRSFTGISSQVAAMASGLGVIGSIGFGLKLAADAETAEAAFTTLTGSAAKAKQLLSDLKAYSKVSSFTFPTATEAAKQMMAYGIQVQDVLPTMKMLGDIAMGDQEKFDHLALALGQTASYGKLRAQERNQFTNAGFNPLSELADMQKRDVSEVAADMEAGKVSIGDVVAALQHATQEGGRFFNSTGAQAKTLGGRFESMKEEIQDALRTLGTEIATQVDLKGMLISATEVARTFPTIIKNIGLSFKLGVLDWGIYLMELNPIVASVGEYMVANYMAAFSAIGNGFTNFLDSVKAGFLETIRFMGGLQDAAFATADNIAGHVIDKALEAAGVRVKKRKSPMEAALEAFTVAQPAAKDAKVAGGDFFTNFFKAREEAVNRFAQDGGIVNTMKAEREKAREELAAKLQAGAGPGVDLGGELGASFKGGVNDPEKDPKLKNIKNFTEAALRNTTSAAKIMTSGIGGSSIEKVALKTLNENQKQTKILGEIKQQGMGGGRLRVGEV